MEGGRDGVGGMGVQGRQSADCSESERAQVRKKGTDAALKVEGRIFPSSDIALTHGEKKRRSCFGRKLREVKRLLRYGTVMNFSAHFVHRAALLNTLP